MGILKKVASAIGGGALEPITKLVDELHHSGEEKVEAALVMSRLQTAVNEVEAKHRSVWVAGWRPAVGWVCAMAMGWNYVFAPIAQWVAFKNGLDLSGAPVIDGNLITVLLGMLGLAGIRTVEKGAGLTR